MHETRPILIVGAGLTSLTAALEPARLKVPVHLVDQYGGGDSIAACLSDPFKGVGKPEPLKGKLTGLWSRRR